MKLIIDGDTPFFRAAAAAQHTEYHVVDGSEELEVFRYKKDSVAFVKDNPDKELEILPELIVEEEYAAIHNVDSIMETMLSEIPHDSYVIYVGGVGNYRYDINPDYKAGRREKPVHYVAAKAHIINKWGAIEVEDMEADDACSMDQWKDIQSTPEGHRLDSMIVSIDKDLLMVPGNHYNWVKKTHTFIPHSEGDYNFHVQLLTGDSTDNIFGLVGIGPAKAAKILEGTTTPRERFEACRRAYTQAGRDDISTVARQIWMSKNKPDDWEEPK